MSYVICQFRVFFGLQMSYVIYQFRVFFGLHMSYVIYQLRVFFGFIYVICHICQFVKPVSECFNSVFAACVCMFAHTRTHVHVQGLKCCFLSSMSRAILFARLITLRQVF